MAYTAKQINDLNRMNRASQNVSLGTELSGVNDLMGAGALVSASHTVTAAEMSASRIVLTTGLDAVAAFFPTYLRSGSPLSPTWTSGSVAGTITVHNSTSASPTTGDVLAYLAF